MEIPKDVSEAKAREASKPKKKLRPGRYRGTVLEVTEGVSANENDTLRAVIGIMSDETEYRLTKVMSATPRGLLVLRHFCLACQAEAEFLAGLIEPAMFLGRELIATIATEPRKGSFPARSVIVDFSRVTDADATPLRSAV